MNRIQLSIMNVIESGTIGKGKSKLIRMKPIGALLLLLAAACFNATAQTVVNFSYTGAPQTWTVPAGVTSITIDAAGARGGNYSGAAGLGGRVQATYAVTPGTTLYIYVGGAGGDASGSSVAQGGYNGGGNSSWDSYGVSGGAGGGATDIRIGGTSLTNRVLVAGGGGGASYWYSPFSGGAGGGTIGGTGGA